MDAMNTTPNDIFPFTIINAKFFKEVSDSQLNEIFDTRCYTIPDYWFEDEDSMLEFSKGLKDSFYFIDYFSKILEHSIKNSFATNVLITLRTNYKIIFVKIEYTGYIETADKLIDLNIQHERYEQCQELVNLKNKFYDSFLPRHGLIDLNEVYMFWEEYYPEFLE